MAALKNRIHILGVFKYKGTLFRKKGPKKDHFGKNFNLLKTILTHERKVVLIWTGTIVEICGNIIPVNVISP